MRYRTQADEIAVVSVKDTGSGVAIIVSSTGVGASQTIAILEGDGVLRLLSLHEAAAKPLGLQMTADGRIMVRRDER